MRRVAAYIPTLAAGEPLVRAVRSLAAQTVPCPVVIADNGATPGLAARLRAEHPDVTVVPMERNRGFGAALNAVVDAHPAEWLLITNDDVECAPGFAEALLERAQAGGADAVAGVLLQHGDAGRIDSAGVVVDPSLSAYDHLVGEPAERALDAPAPLAPTGGAALYRHAAFMACGGFDEAIFAYLEDVDLGLRLRAQGGRVLLAGRARAVHRHSGTLGARTAAKDAIVGRSRGYLLRRYGVLASPGRAARTLTSETIVCTAQALQDRTTAGIRGRVAGWRAARGLPRREIPPGAVLDLSLREALAMRRRQRRARTRHAAA